MAQGPVFGKGNSPDTEIGVVMECTGDRARVKLQASPVCDSCGSSSVCFPREGESPLVDALNTAGAKVGDLVSLERSEGGSIGAALLIFGLPAASTIGGTLLGMNSTPDTTGGAATGAIAGLALGLILLRFINRIVAQRNALTPVVRSILGSREITAC